MNLLVFDSGIGGLGVVREIRRLQPEAGITYLADNAYFPYGEKPDAALLAHIVALLGAAIEAFAPDAVVVACNTASTIALSALRAAYAIPFIGCVPPVKPAAAASRTRQIGVLATAATVRRAYLADLVDKYAGDCTVHTLGTPTLAELAEQKFLGSGGGPVSGRGAALRPKGRRGNRRGGAGLHALHVSAPGIYGPVPRDRLVRPGAAGGAADPRRNGEPAADAPAGGWRVLHRRAGGCAEHANAARRFRVFRLR